MTTRRTITALAASFALLAMGAARAGAGEAADEARKLETYRASARLFDSAAAAARRGDTEAAMRGYASAIEADPSFVEAMVNLARLGIDAAEGDEDLAAARHWLDRAEQVRPDYPKIAATRALLAVREGDTAAALEAIDHAHRLAPDDVEIAVNYGAILIQRERFADARRVLQTALRASPSHTEAIYNLALADDLAGRADRAAYGYGRFLALASHADPQRARVQQRLELLMGANVPAAPAPVSTAGATTASANDSERGSAVAAPSPESREGTHP